MRKIFFSFAAFTVMAGVFALNVFADTTVVVRSVDMAESPADVVSEPNSWFFYNDETNTIDSSLGSFVVGPATAPEGVGSAQISVSGTQRRNLATYQFSGTALADITELKYSTYNPSAGNGGGTNRSGYLNFNVDFNGSDTWQRRLVYVPSVNGTVQPNTWQEWDAIDGGDALWSYSGPTWPVTGEPGTTEKTWNQILNDYPDVRIRVTDSWLGIRVGEPYASGYTENIDAFKFGVNGDTTIFDFEPIVRDAEITSPVSSSIQTGMVDFEAYLVDDDVDSIHWAVRKGTCAAGTNTVFGNVDGHSDVATIDSSDVTNQTFSFTGDMSTMESGIYCFIYNPVEDSGESNIRKTVQFNLEKATPTNKNECKEGGWESFTSPSFKNQGDCVSYVQSNENAKGNKNK